MRQAFQFSMGQTVTIDASGERGTVIGRAEYFDRDNSYLVRYRAANGRAVEKWWSENALSQ